MSGLLVLNADDFILQRSVKGPVMCNGIKNFSLILFYANSDPNCQQVFQVFKQLPGTIEGCVFGIVNIVSNRRIIEMTRNTNSPITYVPYILLYVDGKPWMEYKSYRDPNTIKQFILDAANFLQRKQQFTKGVVVQKQEEVPEFLAGIGVPYKVTDIKYLEFDEAYEGKNNRNDGSSSGVADNTGRSEATLRAPSGQQGRVQHQNRGY